MRRSKQKVLLTLCLQLPHIVVLITYTGYCAVKLLFHFFAKTLAKSGEKFECSIVAILATFHCDFNLKNKVGNDLLSCPQPSSA